MDELLHERLNPRAIVVISDAFPNRALRGCFAVIEHVRSWGAEAIAIGPARDPVFDRAPSKYPVRLSLADMIHTGGYAPEGYVDE